MLRVLLTPRWLGWTLVAVLALAVCGVMTWWQVIRLESPGGSLLNAGYAFQWPLFGLFFAFLWWRMLSAEARGASPGPSGEPGTAASADPLASAERVAVVAASARPGTEPVRAPDVASPFGPRPSGVGPGIETAAPGSARAAHNARLAELAAGEPAQRPHRGPTREDRP